MELLTRAVREASVPAIRDHLRALLLELAIHDERDPLPAGLEAQLAIQREWTRLTWLCERVRADAPGAARRSSFLIPEDEPDESAVYLPEDSPLLAAAQSAEQAGDRERAMHVVATSLPFVKAQTSRPWRCALARLLLSGNQPQRAEEALTVGPVGMPAVSTHPESLYYLGLARERLGKAELARSAYAELARASGIDPGLRSLVEEAQKRLGAGR